MLRILRGLGIPPIWTGTARAFVEAVVMAAIVAGGAYLTSDARFIAFAPAILFIERWFEGLADHIDPEKKTAP